MDGERRKEGSGLGTGRGGGIYRRRTRKIESLLYGKLHGLPENLSPMGLGSGDGSRGVSKKGGHLWAIIITERMSAGNEN